jgi:1,4-dihydroxy-2-naphthoate polyprenyltransferase
MNRMLAALLRSLLQAARPWTLLAGALLYAIGGGIASYLGVPIRWTVFWSGMLIVLLLQLSSYFLHEYFDRPAQPPFEQRMRRPPPPQPSPDGNGSSEEKLPDPPTPRVVFLQIASTTLTIGTVLTVLLYGQGMLNLSAFFFLSVALFLALLYAVPPFRLVYTGYGELVMAFLIANLFPTLAYVLQAGEMHRLLAMLTFPLTFLYLAAVLARSLQRYYEDVKFERQTMMARLGWQRGMSLHNILIAGAYIFLAVSVFFGLPWNLAFPALLGLPVGVYQIYQMNSIANGGKPRWRVLAVTAAATVSITAYLINLALWTE